MKRTHRRAGDAPFQDHHTITVMARKFIENTARTIVDLMPDMRGNRGLSRIFEVKAKAPQVVRAERRLRRARRKQLLYLDVLNDVVFFAAGCGLTLLLVTSGCAKSVGLTLQPVKIAGSSK